MAGRINLAELPPEVRAQLNLKAPRRRSMTMHDVRTAAIRVMAVVADLTPTDRRRVLRHAAKLNEV
ncbi:MAG: hypothetical protein ACJ768_19555 [Gaiellaceae bacterium]